MTLLPTGGVDLLARARPLDEMVGEAWPEGLWICAARRTDGARRGLRPPGSAGGGARRRGRGLLRHPRLLQPGDHRGVEYFDGGVHSPTNASVLRHRPLDAVVVVSPMSASSRFAAGPTAPSAGRFTVACNVRWPGCGPRASPSSPSSPARGPDRPWASTPWPRTARPGWRGAAFDDVGDRLPAMLGRQRRAS